MQLAWLQQKAALLTRACFSSKHTRNERMHEQREEDSEHDQLTLAKGRLN